MKYYILYLSTFQKSRAKDLAHPFPKVDLAQPFPKVDLAQPFPKVDLAQLFKKVARKFCV